MQSQASRNLNEPNRDPTRAEEDDVSMISEPSNRASTYQAYHPSYEAEVTARRSSYYAVSPLSTHGPRPPFLTNDAPPVPPLPARNSPIEEQPSIPTSPGLRASLFPSDGNPQQYYHEAVAWANSTQFRPTDVDPQSRGQHGANHERQLPNPDQQTSNRSSHPVAAGLIERKPLPPPPPPLPPPRQYYRKPRHLRHPWEVGYWLRLPLWGFGSIAAVILLTGASAGVIIASNGMPVADWKALNPHIWVSIFQMLMNLLTVFTLVDGMAITFWTQLLKGTTLASVYDIFDSVFFWSALKRVVRLKFNIVAVACLLAVISFTRGPLFQGSLGLAQNRSVNRTSDLTLPIAPFPIPEYFQTDGSDPRRQGGITTAFAKTLGNVKNGNPLSYNAPAECGDACSGMLKGFAFKTECTSSAESFDFSSLPADCATCTAQECNVICGRILTGQYNPTFFAVEHQKANGAMVITTTFKNTSSCRGDIQKRSCRLSQVTSDYPIVIEDGTIRRLPTETNTVVQNETMRVDAQVMDVYWPLAFETLFPSVSVNVTPRLDLSGFSYQKCVKPDSTDLLACGNGTALHPRIVDRDPSILFATPETPPPSSADDKLCSLTWRDPMPDMIDALQSLAFQITVDMAASDGSVFALTLNSTALSELRKPWIRQLSVVGRHKHTVYTVNFIPLGFAIAVSVIGILSTLPLYNEFWTLGRKVTLNPLEVARAFGAPLLDGLDGNVTSEVIAIERGGMDVKYGVVDRPGEEKKLRIETASVFVRAPWKEEILG